MPFRGWFSIDGQEFANSSRVVAHLRAEVPTQDPAPSLSSGGFEDSFASCRCRIKVPYDDTWPGLAAALGDAPYAIDNAPWIDASKPESREFAGVWVMDVQGLDSVPISREITEGICAGGVAGRARDTSRTLTFSAVIVACTNAGAEYGRTWLACVLRSANVRGGVALSYYKAHPENSSADPIQLRRTGFGAVMTKSPQVTEFAGKGGGARHRQASIYRVEWEMVLTKPYVYGANQVLAVDWNTTVEESITWAHAPDCEDTASCDLPTIYNAECALPDVPLSITEIPTCGGCLPLCAIERRTWELAGAPGTCEETTVSIRVTNEGDTPLTVNFFWRPCDSTERCDRVSPLQVSGLPGGYTVVADSVSGRPYIDTDGVQQRQVGIVSTPNGAPWQPALLDTMFCWELVAESAPGAQYSVIIEMRDRDA